MKWRREKPNSRPMTCECVGNGNAEWYCEYVDMCKFNNQFYLPGVHWTTIHKASLLCLHVWRHYDVDDIIDDVIIDGVIIWCHNG